ncbi:Cyclin [Rhizoctonia solani]|uniref:Cyclin n=1 Tax=Rhizoctonia solani TaxID=456999 RepID=A0A8H7IBC8_9AGAM|nr:Cyclin [Rhizoctonia solani]
MAYTSAYLTPPDLSPVSPRMVPPTVRPRSGGDSRWQPYYPRARSLTPTSGLRSSRSTDSIPSTSSSNKTWPQPAPKSRYPYTAYDPASYAHQYTSPPERTEIGSKFYITPDPSPRPVRHARKASYPVPPTIDEEFATHRYRAALPPTPPRTTSRASAGSEKSAPIPPCSIDAPHARQAFTKQEQLYDTLMSIYYCSNSPSSAPKVYMPVPGSLPVDPTTLQWFTTELIRRASVPGGVLKLALSYMIRARSAALRACEAQTIKKSLWIDHSSGPELADPRQMLLGALVLAQKFLIDAAYTSATWGKLSGLSASNVAAVERTLGTALDWRLWDQSL